VRQKKVCSKVVIYATEVNLDVSVVSHRKIKCMWGVVFVYIYARE
jgi:hypothetical protein